MVNPSVFMQSFRFIVASALLILLSHFYTNAQNTHLPYSAGNKEKINAAAELSRNIELTAGYLFKSGNEGLKAGLGVNNLVFHRIGFYTSLEYALDGKNFSNTVGGTVSIFKYAYVWGGMDFFTKKGLFQSGFEGIRKEAGVGITPYKFLVFRVGWSSSVGPSVAAGVRIQI